MRKFLLLVILAVSINSFGQNKISKTIKIPFELLESGHILIKVKINNVEGNFVFDTGAGLNLLTKKFAGKIENLRKTDNFYTGHRASGEQLTSDLWDIETLEIGTLSSNSQKFTVFDVEFPFDGLISLLPFREIPITIDYKNKMLVLETDKSLKELIKTGTEIPIQVADNFEKTLEIATYVKLNDKLTLQMNLDSGAGFNVYRFSSRYMEKLGVDSTKVESRYRPSEFDPKKGTTNYFTKLPKLSAQSSDKIKTSDFRAIFSDDLIYEAIGSINWLGEKITIDIQKKNLIINN